MNIEAQGHLSRLVSKILADFLALFVLIQSLAVAKGAIILVACINEIKTILFWDVTSNACFKLPCWNFSVPRIKPQPGHDSLI